MLGVPAARRAGVAGRSPPYARPVRSGSGWCVVGVLWFGAYNVALNAAEQRLDAGTAAMLVNVGPILIAVLAGLLLGEGFPRRLLVGQPRRLRRRRADRGLVVVRRRRAVRDTWGVVLCLGAAAAYAVSVVTQKPLLARLPALQVTWIACTIGALCCLPFAGSLWHDLRGRWAARARVGGRTWG